MLAASFHFQLFFRGQGKLRAARMGAWARIIPDNDNTDSNLSMAESVLYISWRDHTSNLAAMFQSFLENNSFVDCTISAEGQSLQAHRLVLSICSPYFHKLFSEETEDHPFVVLLDESFQTLKALIDFIYQGELQVAKNNLTEFLTLAQNLEIKGLNAFARAYKNTLLGSTTENVPQDPSEKGQITGEVKGTNASQKDSSENDSPKIPHPQDGNRDAVQTTSPGFIKGFSDLYGEAKSTSTMIPSLEQQRPQGALRLDVQPPLIAAIPEGRNELLIKSVGSLSGNFKEGENASVAGAPTFLLLFSSVAPPIAGPFTLPPVCEQPGQEESSEGPTTSGGPAGANPKEKKNLSCDVCGMTFTTLTGLVGHKRKHTGERPYLCDVCGASFASKHHLTCHLRLHTGERPYSCEYCGKTFRQKSNLNLHLPLHTGVLPHRCNECGKTFIQKQLFTEHVRLHTGERPHRCDVCGVMYRRLNSLRLHKLKHTGERPYRCDVCGKTYRHKNGLKSHMPQHTGLRPYECDECGKTFAHKHGLAIHQRTHTGERPFCCEMCGKTFSLKGALVVHTRTHTGERPYRCEECGLGFTQQCGLNYHNRTQHPAEPP